MIGRTRGAQGPGPRTPLSHVPVHVAIIMDGNGRWARRRGLLRAAGHRAGTENLRPVLRAAVEFGIEILTIYAFSTENWSRPESEVSALLGLVERVIDRELDDLHENGVRLKHIGRRQGISSRLLAKIDHAEELTRSNDRLILNIAFNYGGRAELVDAVQMIVQKGLAPEQIDEGVINEHLTTSGMPDPDLVIRTGGDLRLSNFLIWQSIYAEFYSTATLWPDFGSDELYKAIASYEERQRRYGGVKP